MTAVIFKFQQPDGEPVVGAPFTVSLRKSSFDETNEDGILLPGTVEGVTDAQGLCTLELAPGYGLYYLFMLTPGGVEDVDGCMPGMRYKFMVPESDVPVHVEDLIVTVPTFSRPWDEVALSVIIDAKASALNSAERAETAAQTIEGDADRAEVAAASALNSKNAAAGSADTAAILAEQARVSAVNSGNSANAAASSATSATASAATAISSKDAAAVSAAAALDSKNAAAASATTATTQATSATGSATTATTQAAAALASKNAAALSATSASTSATTATTQAGIATTEANRSKTEADRAAAATDGKQPLATNLTAFAGLAGAADRLPYFTGAGALSLAVLTAKARLLLARTDTAGMQAELGLVPAVSTTDTTAGRLALVGQGGVGSATPIMMDNTADADTLPAINARFVFGNGGAHLPAAYVYIDQFTSGTGTWTRQFAYGINSADMWERFFIHGAANAAVWSPIVVGQRVIDMKDVTAGRLVTPGWMGLGTKEAPSIADCNLALLGGKYKGYNLLNAPVSGIVTLEVTGYTTDWITQTLREVSNIPRVFERSWYGGTTFSSWVEVFTSGNALTDPASGGLMSSASVSGWNVYKYANGLMFMQAYAGTTGVLPANTVNVINITIPSGFISSGLANPAVNLVPYQSYDTLSAPECAMLSLTTVRCTIRTGPTSQNFAITKSVWGVWK